MNEFRAYTPSEWDSIGVLARIEALKMVLSETTRLGLPYLGFERRDYLALQRAVLIARAEEGTAKCVGEWIDSLP